MTIHPTCKIINLDQTPEKFHGTADTIVLPFLEALLQIIPLEEEFSLRYQALDEEKITLGIPKSESHPQASDLWTEIKQRYTAILQPICTNRIVFFRGTRYPSRYQWVINGVEEISFIMKSKNKATLAIRYPNYGSLKHYQYIFKLIDDAWKIADIKEANGRSPDKYHTFTAM